MWLRLFIYEQTFLSYFLSEFRAISLMNIYHLTFKFNYFTIILFTHHSTTFFHVVPKVTSSNYTFMYHPLTGLCIQSDYKSQILADDCHRLTGWNHDGDQSPIQLSSSPLCIEMVGDGLPVRLTADCNAKQSTTWKSVPNSMFQIASKDCSGVDLCLDYDPNSSSNILSKRCICAGDNRCLQNPQSQWFQFVSTNSKRF
ncbi:putative ricin B-like lectin [Helianthus anomalus]